MLFPPFGLFSIALLSANFCSQVAAENALARAQAALNTLQTWYSPATGLWTTRRWWNSTSALTTIAKLAKVDPSAMETAIYVFNITFTLAPASNPHPGPEVKTVLQRRGLLSRAGSSGNASQWLDSAYDDDGWWALAWIAAYDVTGNESYLELAEEIFSALLFLSVAAHLANRVPSRREEYISWAQREWDWFSAQGFMGDDHTINDGLLGNCQNNGQTIWSYNQGVVLGGLVELNKATSASLLGSANTIAQAAIKTLADSNMVIRESCEPNSCAPDATQFKGIFIHNLHLLQEVSPNNIYKQIIDSCAASIWANDRNSLNQLGIDWAGPFQDPADMSTHSSAMNALVAAISFR